VNSSAKRKKRRKKNNYCNKMKEKKGRLGDGKSLELHHHCWHESKLAKPNSSLAGFKAS
jgi:hypothetical protein